MLTNYTNPNTFIDTPLAKIYYLQKSAVGAIAPSVLLKYATASGQTQTVRHLIEECQQRISIDHRIVYIIINATRYGRGVDGIDVYGWWAPGKKQGSG